MLWMLLAAAATSPAAPAPHTDAGYAQARDVAWREEASLDAAASTIMIGNLGEAGGKALQVCLPKRTERVPPVFTVVLQLDARGKVGKAWGQGEPALVACMKHELTGKTVFAPPQAPFHVAFELLPDDVE
ncbi:hypothetical protein [Stenotrophomonas sp. 24(2023)]|uniref:hypothetical protein n=1 Tax=Stenotrophomonas sp. 24(2023) TaxID=3068324 RepID=UPI0027E14EA5|nr:hypothetical protein [Stenotrophomonas sp. 24(2023)]WMJ70562.1 hypothetical protein Q9R17_05535 [Stenotrophomonas sp. 24(2023)]